MHVCLDLQKSAEFTERNPMQQVPVLEVNGEPLSQSVRAVAELIASGIQPLQNIGILFKLEQSKRNEWAVEFISKGFQALEAVLAKTAGKYCVGDSVTMADACLVPQVYNAKRFKVDLAPYPTIVR
ncbi:hypothetical protein HPB47_016239, partial [Ixodes persulcatus]